jgi:hypothetical protein
MVYHFFIMSENTVRHLIALAATLAGTAVWWSGYFAGTRGWWFTFITIGIVYAIVYKLVDA